MGLGLGLGEIKKSRQINQSRHMNESRQINQSRDITESGQVCDALNNPGGNPGNSRPSGSENRLSYLHLYDLLTETSLEN